VKRWDLAILTEGQYITPLQIDGYVKNVLTEQELVQNALEAKGLLDIAFSAYFLILQLN